MTIFQKDRKTAVMSVWRELSWGGWCVRIKQKGGR